MSDETQRRVAQSHGDYAELLAERNELKAELAEANEKCLQYVEQSEAYADQNEALREELTDEKVQWREDARNWQTRAEAWGHQALALRAALAVTVQETTLAMARFKGHECDFKRYIQATRDRCAEALRGTERGADQPTPSHPGHDPDWIMGTCSICGAHQTTEPPT